MIRVAQEGFYKLIETKNQVKILYLDNDIFAWPETKQYGEMLVTSHRLHKTDCTLSVGHYYIYAVEDEERLIDNKHLELEVGLDKWQGYLLLTGLPDDRKIRARIIPTHEIISGNPRFKNHTEMHQTLANQ